MAIPDKFHKMLQNLIKEKNIQSPEELQQLLDSFTGQSMDDIFTAVPKDLSDEGKALELVWEAHELPIDKGRRRAKKALKLNPDCIEAYEYLGNTYQYYHKMQPYFQKGVDIGKRIWGGEFLKQNKGHFYMISETRPFMRCLGSLAECYHGPGQAAKAVEIWKEMIDLNPNDNQGIRYNLLAGLLEINNLKEYPKYRKMFPDEDSTMTLFSDVLKVFKEEGPSKKATKLLTKAKRENKFVISILTATYPPEKLPTHYSWGTEEEAIIYAQLAWRAWKRAEGAREWLERS